MPRGTVQVCAAKNEADSPDAKCEIIFTAFAQSGNSKLGLRNATGQSVSVQSSLEAALAWCTGASNERRLPG